MEGFFACRMYLFHRLKINENKTGTIQGKINENKRDIFKNKYLSQNIFGGS